MVDSLEDLHARVVQALADADALRLDDVGIALDTARINIEKHIVAAKVGDRARGDVPDGGQR